MSTHFLPVYDHNALVELSERVPQILHGASSFEFALESCQQYRIKGICSLLLTARAEEFLLDLQKSGAMMAHFMAQAGPSSLAMSQMMPLFDAVASGDLATAKQIATLARTTWNSNAELEDDFLYVHFLLHFFLLKSPPTDCQSILTRYEVVLDGFYDPRLDICKGLFARDGDLFRTAFAEFLDAYDARYRKLREADAIAPEVVATEGKVCVEAIALLKLASQQGFPLQADYLFVPSIAMNSTLPKFQPDGWQHPDAT